MNQNEREGQSSGRTTGASGTEAEEQQNRTIEGQESQPGKGWQAGGQGQYTGQGDTSTAGSDVGGGTGGESSGGNPPGQYSGQGGSTDPEAVQEQMDETQWQGNRFSQGGGIGNQGGSNG